MKPKSSHKITFFDKIILADKYFIIFFNKLKIVTDTYFHTTKNKTLTLPPHISKYDIKHFTVILTFIIYIFSVRLYVRPLVTILCHNFLLHFYVEWVGGGGWLKGQCEALYRVSTRA